MANATITRSDVEEFVKRFSGRTRLAAKMGRYSSMKVGGLADVLAMADSAATLIEAITLAEQLGLRWIVVAGGSNLLFPDEGFRGVVVAYVADDLEVAKDRHSITVQAGRGLNRLVVDLASQNLGGITFLANIPGSVAGAVVGNAGCYGKEIADVLVCARIWNKKTNQIEVWQPEQFAFVYRHSKLKETTDFIVLDTKLKVVDEARDKILLEVMEEKALRLYKHPHQPSCGSFFKNPERGIAAWKFIEQAGMKGKSMGGARVSAKHANHIINIGGATAAQILELARMVKREVWEKTGIKLEAEVRMIDELGEYLVI